jgi:molybdopterin-guanine dinucleotide biosynthesis protein A
MGGLFMSLRRGQNLAMPGWEQAASPLYDSQDSIGPAAGLLAAFEADATATWAVLACDYVLTESATFVQLVDTYRDPGVCMAHPEDGQPEPLIAIWSPPALAALAANVAAGWTGPCRTLKQVGMHLVLPSQRQWLINVNTPDELAQAEAVLTQAPALASGFEVATASFPRDGSAACAMPSH